MRYRKLVEAYIAKNVPRYRLQLNWLKDRLKNEKNYENNKDSYFEDIIEHERLGDKIKALQSYLDRPLSCKLGFHKRRPRDVLRKQRDTCQVCYIEEVIRELAE
jgi:hypothetical protein